MHKQSAMYALYKAQSFWNVPATFTSLVGREQELATITNLLHHPDTRLLTLLGPGGIGKTRLSIQVARETRGYFSDGICFVALASIRVAEQVMPAIAEALGIQQLADMQVFEQVTNVLDDRQVLLILDNFEQVVAAAPLLEDLLAACPLLTVLVTSREVLHLQAEREFPVSPLALPSATQVLKSEEIAAYPAITLFVQRAQAVLPNFRLTPANAQAIAEICARLDGLPLAIELAAARVKLFPPEALLKRLAQRIHMLSSEKRTLPERHRTLFNTIKWSYDLLDDREQWLFRRLSIFVGGWTLQAVEAVCAGRNDLVVLDGIASLLDKSLLVRLEQAGEEEEPRLRMLMTVREYALESLREQGEMEQVQLAHATYCLSLAEEAEPDLKGAGQLAWLARLEQEQDNLRAALERLITSREAELALRLCGALWRFWFRRGYWSEGRGWLRAALALPAERVQAKTRAKALCAAGELAWYQADDAEARTLLEESVALYRQLGDEHGLIRPLSTLGSVIQDQGELAAGDVLEEESIALSRKLDDKWELASALHRKGHNTWFQNDPARAVMLMEESLAVARTVEDLSLTVRILNDLAYIAWQQRDLARAAALTKENLLLARALDDAFLLNNILETLGLIALDRGDPVQAKANIMESVALAKQLGRKGYPIYCLTLLARVAAAQGQFRQAAFLYGVVGIDFPNDRLMNADERAEYERNVASVRVQLGEQPFAAAWAEGRASSVERAFVLLEAGDLPESVPVAFHRPSLVQVPPRLKYPDDLTPREVEVLRLLARGWSDAQIAEQLVISRRTVNKHTASIYSKIAVKSRSAATRYAIERSLT